jgi:uncharacterized protein YgbK (DUF1537 family)
MTDEDRQRQMDFILEQQAQFTVNIQQLREQQGRSDARIDRVAAIVEALALSAQAQSERMDSSDARVTRVDERLDRFVDASDRRASRVDERLDRLVETVDRYIKARGNGSNGAGGNGAA